MIEEIPGGVRLRLHIQPNASKSEIAGPHNGALKVRLQAPPVDGKANEELISFLSRLMGVSKRSIVLTKGETSRQKTVEINGVDFPTAQKLLVSSQ